MTKQKQVQLEYYQNHIDDYEKEGAFQRTLNRSFKRKARIILNNLNPKENNKILEVGAGSGLLTYFMTQMCSNSDYFAQDISSKMIEKAKERLNDKVINFSVGDASLLPNQNDFFDFVLGSDIIHHLEFPINALDEWRRVTKPNGRICILESNANNPLILRQIGIEHEVRVFLNTKKNLFKWMKLAGWRNIEIVPAPSFTPANPLILEPIFEIIDKISIKIPIWRNLSAYWIVMGKK